MLYVGVDYYPEHWPEDRWETDATMMQEAGFNVVRLAEFAWVKMEPIEGSYDFEWLDRAIDILHKHDIKVILGTPTGSMPAWVAIKYPEVVAVDRNGRRIPYGARKDNCPSSLSYRLLSQRITRAMAGHFASNPAVIGWQTDNEFGGPNCYCNTCKAAWQDWLNKRFGDIDKLNESWGTIFWGHTYRTWSEIPLPLRHGSNPSLELGYARFHSHQVVSFQKEQIEILRNLCPDHFITHNLMGFYDNLNYYDLAKDLDFVSWDYYYNYNSGYSERMGAYTWGAASHDLMRSLNHKSFWIMETTAGATGSTTYSRNVRPGEMRRMNYQAVAHGADGLVWFRWRTCRFGQEQYWHGLLGHDGKANRRYREAARVAGEFKRIQDDIASSQVKNRVAIALSYDDQWAFRIQPNSRKFSYLEHLMNYYKALYKQGVGVDFVDMRSDDISGYSLLVAPTIYVLTSETGKKLRDFVEKGGILVLTFRSGVKDAENVPYALTLPGLLSDMTGIRVEEYEALDDTQYLILVDGAIEAGEYPCSVLADWIMPETAQIIARYMEKGLESYAAATVKDFGKGQVYYIGTSVLKEEFYDRLMKHVLKRAGVESVVKPVDGVEIAVRYQGEIPFIFVLNHRDESVNITVPQGRELLSGQYMNGRINITAGDVAIIKVTV